MNIETKILMFYLSLSDLEKRKFEDIFDYKLKKILVNADLHSIMNYLNSLSHDRSNLYYDRSTLPPSEIDRDSAMMQIVRKIEDTTNSNASLARTIESLIGTKITRKEKRSKSELRGILIDGLMSAPRSQLLKIKNELIKKIQKTQVVPESESNLDKWFSIILENKQ
jgi:hypothetical protein